MPTAGEGRTTTVCNLGLTMAKAGARVLVVDADLRSPSIARYLGVPGTPGLTDVLEVGLPVEAAIRPVGQMLDALPSGLCPPNPSELLGSQQMADLLATLRERYDVVLIDTSPLLPVTDAAVLALRVDAVLVVAREGRTNVQERARGQGRTGRGVGQGPGLGVDDGSRHRRPPTETARRSRIEEVVAECSGVADRDSARTAGRDHHHACARGSSTAAAESSTAVER